MEDWPDRAAGPLYGWRAGLTVQRALLYVPEARPERARRPLNVEGVQACTDRFGTHFTYRVRIGRFDTNFGGEMLRAEGGGPQKLGTNSLKFQLTPKWTVLPPSGFFETRQIWDPFYV